MKKVGTSPNAGSAFGGAGGTPTPADPGDNRRWQSSGSLPNVTLSFDSPVAAFGVSFSMLSCSAATILEVFFGLNGAGTSRGMVSPIFPVGSDTIDFVGLWSDAVDIQSVVLSNSANKG